MKLRDFNIFLILWFHDFMRIFIENQWLCVRHLGSQYHLLLREVNWSDVEVLENIVDLGVSHSDMREEGELGGEDLVADAAGVT